MRLCLPPPSLPIPHATYTQALLLTDKIPARACTVAAAHPGSVSTCHRGGHVLDTPDPADAVACLPRASLLMEFHGEISRSRSPGHARPGPTAWRSRVGEDEHRQGLGPSESGLVVALPTSWFPHAWQQLVLLCSALSCSALLEASRPAARHYYRLAQLPA